MSCCGHSRAGSSALPRPAGNGPGADRPAIFEYVGRTALTIVGPLTGTTYRFPHPGARSEVHRRDRASLNTVPVLREVAVA